MIDGLYCLEVSGIDYREYEHKEGDVVYCDPPYKGTKAYCGKYFDNDAFMNGQGQEIIQFTFLSTMPQMTSFAFGASQYARCFQVESHLTTRQLKNCLFTRGSHNEDKVRIRKQRQ